MNLHLNLLGLEPINTLYVLFRCPMSPGLWSCCEQSPFSNALPLRFGDKNDAYIFDFFFFFSFCFLNLVWPLLSHLLIPHHSFMYLTPPPHTYTHEHTLQSSTEILPYYYISLSSCKTLHNKRLVTFVHLFLLLKIRQLILVTRVYFHVIHPYPYL